MDVLEKLRDAGALSVDSHFIYTSGRHGSAYINLDPLLPDVSTLAALCQDLAKPFRGTVDTVIAPAVGAIPLAVLTAVALSADGDPVTAVWADKVEGGFAVERAGFAERLTGRRVLIVEDLLTTGGSVAAVCQAAQRHGAVLVGIGALCNRGNVTAAQLDVPQLHTLASVDFGSADADDCGLCAAGVPIVENIGHGREFRAQRPNYVGGYVRLGTAIGGGSPRYGGPA